MVVPGDGGQVTVPCLVGRHFPNGLDLVAIMALERPRSATLLSLLADRLQAPNGDSFGWLAPLLVALHPTTRSG